MKRKSSQVCPAFKAATSTQRLFICAYQQIHSTLLVSLQDVLNQGWAVPDVDVYVDLFDKPDAPVHNHACGPQGPVLAQCKVAKSDWHVIMIPDFTFKSWREVCVPSACNVTSYSCMHMSCRLSGACTSMHGLP